MTDTSRLYRRILRRETHSPRSVTAIVIAVLLIVTAVWVGAEAILALANQPALLASPGAVFLAASGLPDATPAAAVTAAGLAAAVLGALLVSLALAPGRRPRHVGVTSRTAVVVDDRVVAAALAAKASHSGGLDPSQIRVTVMRRRAEVRATPTSGIPIDRAGVAEVVAEALASYELTPPLRPHTVVERRGTVGA